MSAQTAAATVPNTQPAAAASSSAITAPSSELNQRIAGNIRAHFKVPEQVKIEVGSAQPSALTGYDAVKVTLVNGEKRSPYDFYISKDGKTLAQLNKLDVSQDPFAPGSRPSRGAPGAKVTIIVYDDFQCPYCARGYKTLFSEILPEYKDKIRIVYKDFPLSEIHPWAIHAAVDANCLFSQSSDAYWDFADYVHLNQGAIRGENRPIEQQYAALDESAEKYGNKHALDSARLQACIKAQDSKEVLASEHFGENTLQIDATPTMFVNGTRFDGAVPADAMREVLDAALRDQGVAPPAHAAPAANADPKPRAGRSEAAGSKPESNTTAARPNQAPSQAPPKP